jgi:hypothetical protein
MNSSLTLKTKLLLLVLLSLAVPSYAAPAAQRPNVVYIMSDDVGWGDLSVHGGGVRTPNIDRLFSQGVEHRIVGLASTAPGPLGKHGVVFNGGKAGTYTIYLDNLRIRHADGSTTPLWTNGQDTRAGKFTANELFKDLKIRAVNVAEAGK